MHREQSLSPRRPFRGLPTRRRSRSLGCASLVLQVARKAALSSVALLAVTALSEPQKALAGDFVDTRLNVTLTNENVLAKPGETNPPVPGWRFDRPNQLGVLFFDNYDTRFTGYESLTHIVLYKAVQRQRWEAEGAYVLRLLQFSDVNLSSIDDGSYLKVNYYFDKTRQRRTNISVTAFPLNSDRMRLGYSWRLSWGGSPIFFKANPDIPTNINPPPTPPVPGLRVQIADDRWYAYLGAKTSVLRYEQDQELHSVYGLLGGAGVDIIPGHFRIETNGGFFDRGTIPRILTQQLPVQTFGASFQVSIFNGLPPTLSADTALYRNDPYSAARYLTKPVYTPGFSWLVMSEFTAEGTTLENPDQADSSRRQWGLAGDVNVRLQYGSARFRLDATYRSLEFLLLNQPSLVPFQDFPREQVADTTTGTMAQAGATVNPNLFAAAGFDYFIERSGTTVGLTVGVDRPASYRPPPGGVNPLEPTSAVLVVRNQGDVVILPTGMDVLPAIATKLMARQDFLEMFALIAETYYQYDPNGTRLVTAADMTKQRVFEFPHRLGFNFTLQARF
jgi:hypothetical protein